MISTLLKKNTFTLIPQEKSSVANFATWKIEGGTRDFRVLKRFIYKRKDYEMNAYTVHHQGASRWRTRNADSNRLRPRSPTSRSGRSEPLANWRRGRPRQLAG